MWSLWCANEYGIENAEAYLNAFLDSEEINVTSVLWVLGMGTQNPVTVKDGYVIRPIHEMPNSREKERFVQIPFPMVFSHPLAPRCAITKTSPVKKARIPTEPMDQGERQKFEVITRRMDEIAWLLNALDGICCVPFLRTGFIEPTLPFGPFGGWNASGPMHDVLGMANTMLPDQSAGTIADLLAGYDRLDEAERMRIQRILSRLSQAKRGMQIEDKILDLGIAMEMLLLEDNRNNEQLSLTFRLRGSWLLGSSATERKEILERLKEVYKYRSEVAHSGTLRNVSGARDRFPRYQSLAEAICRRIIKDGKPDWDSLIVGAV